MAKKRPSVTAGRLRKIPRSRSRMDPRYWRDRLFRNTFTHNGKRFQVNHWSVKIQHQGTRKTFSLRAGYPAQAAREACELYGRIVTRGWTDLYPRHKAGLEKNSATGTPATEENLFDPNYWAQRLIHRKYTEELHPQASREFSVRLHHDGASSYFPLRTGNRKVAANRAVKIYQLILRKGWHFAAGRFPRELSVALRWLDNPVAWTYATIHTQVSNPGQASFVSGSTSARLRVAIVESDESISRALAWCLNQQDGFYCVASFGTAASAIRELPRLPIQLVLLNQNLTDNTGSGCLHELKRVAPNLPGLLFSAYEDADQLFKSAPGGAASYLFRRTSPKRLLEPIADTGIGGLLTRETMTTNVCKYFERAIESLSSGSSGHQLTGLTQREHEILGLLSKGQADKEISDLLGISTWTVHGHLKKIFEKLRAHNRTEAVLRFLHK